ncbi:MAG: hypothetical protein E8D41_15465 [Nitrospira sp.]|nr:MAG: hypothetical protein E8D41_15465 [Nitrospira sp.]
MLRSTATVRGNSQTGELHNFALRFLLRSTTGSFCALLVVGALISPVYAEEPPEQTETLSPATAETPDPIPDPTSDPTPDASPAPVASAAPITIDPFIKLRGSVWRTKAGIVFLKTPIGLLSLSSKTTLKDLKASQEIRFWVHERHVFVEIRKRADDSLVHRYLSGPMTPGTNEPGTLHWWGPDGDLTVHAGKLEERLTSYREGDPLTVEVDETNTISGVHDLQFDLQIGQAPPAGSDVQLLLSGTVSKLKSNFVFVRTPVGLVMLNSKIGVPRVKVGQPITVHIDSGHVTVTLPSAETATPRHSASPTP